MRRIALFLSAALATACATDGDEADLVPDQIEQGDTSDVKADQADLPLAVQSFHLPTPPSAEAGRVFRSANAFKSYFKVDPPRWVDFDHQWLAYYAADASEPGAQVAIARVRYTDSGKTLKVTAKVASPDAACAAGPYPYSFVAFPRPAVAPTSVRFARTDAVQACHACGAPLDAALTEATAGLLFTSESDYPWQVVHVPGGGYPTIAKILAVDGAPADAHVETRTFDDFMSWPTHDDPSEDADDRGIGARYRALRAVLKANLTRLTVIRVGTIQVHVYVVGRTSCGDLVAISTISIET